MELEHTPVNASLVSQGTAVKWFFFYKKQVGEVEVETWEEHTGLIYQGEDKSFFHQNVVAWYHGVSLPCDPVILPKRFFLAAPGFPRLKRHLDFDNHSEPWEASWMHQDQLPQYFKHLIMRPSFSVKQRSYESFLTLSGRLSYIVRSDLTLVTWNYIVRSSDTCHVSWHDFLTVKKRDLTLEPVRPVLTAKGSFKKSI